MYSGARKSCTKAINEIFSGNMLIISGMYSQGNIGMAFWVIRHKTGRLAHSWALGSWDTECQDCQRAAGVSTVRLGHCQMTHLYWQTATDAKRRHSQRANWHQAERICKSLCLWHKAKLFCIFIHEFCTYYSLCATIDCSFYLYFSLSLKARHFHACLGINILSIKLEKLSLSFSVMAM